MACKKKQLKELRLFTKSIFQNPGLQLFN